MRKQRRSDARAGVLYTDDDLRSNLTGFDPDVSSLIGVFGSVVQEIPDHLGQTRQVALESQRLQRQFHVQAVVARANQRTTGLDRMPHDIRDIDRILLQDNLPTNHPGNIQQIVHQPDQVTRLPLDYPARPIQLRPAIVVAQNLHRAANRC